jgi:hypothetical protein
LHRSLHGHRSWHRYGVIVRQSSADRLQGVECTDRPPRKLLQLLLEGALPRARHQSEDRHRSWRIMRRIGCRSPAGLCRQAVGWCLTVGGLSSTSSTREQLPHTSPCMLGTTMHALFLADCGTGYLVAWMPLWFCNLLTRLSGWL